ncbi:MAG: ImmA/IrrE family metallo-endopeptidase [Oscillospiraceae bacterium]|nr:ImmA/IrrE family metallo-endopeptidase [Oscillospiraceae bacterium]
MEEREVILQDLPTSVRGFVFQGEDGEPVIVVNSRLTREQNRRTFRHEKKHIKLNELTDPTYNEYKEENT